MPIYAYRCESCGLTKDVLQKISDAPLSDCPACGKATFRKQVTAAGFQLKGSGWYVTDFRDGGGTKRSSSGVSQNSQSSQSSSDTAGSATPAPTTSSTS